MQEISLRVPGIRLDGTFISRYWDNIDDLPESGRLVSGFRATCPDVGTMKCLSCDLGLDRYLDVCDMSCRVCAGKKVCPCSRIGYERRRKEVGGG